MASSIKEIEDIINQRIGPVFNRNGFKLRKKDNTYVGDRNNQREEFQISIKNANNHFNIHLILSVYNESIGNLRASVKKLMPATRHSISLSAAMKAQIEKNNSLIASLTDWKPLDPMGNLHIWFEAFDNLEEVENLDEQLQTAVNLGISWFKLCTDSDFIIQSNIERGLEPSLETALLFIHLNKNESLDTIFKKIVSDRLSKKLNTSSIEAFYNALKTLEG